MLSRADDHRDGGIEAALPDDAAPRLARLRASTRLRLPHCCVLLAAQTADAALATFDDRLASSAIDLGLTVRH